MAWYSVETTLPYFSFTLPLDICHHSRSNSIGLRRTDSRSEKLVFSPKSYVVQQFWKLDWLNWIHCGGICLQNMSTKGLNRYSARDISKPWTPQVRSEIDMNVVSLDLMKWFIRCARGGGEHLRLSRGRHVQLDIMTHPNVTANTIARIVTWSSSHFFGQRTYGRPNPSDLRRAEHPRDEATRPTLPV
jgi:hypothetical protein